LELSADRHDSVFVVRVCCPDRYFIGFLANLYASSADVFTRVVERLADEAKKRFQPNSVKILCALLLVTSFSTVEDFWAIYNHIQLSSKLPTGCDYMLFKQGIAPMWGDVQNREGGRWLLTTDKKKRAQDLDRVWLETLLCLIGESFDDASEDICGACVQIRQKADKVAIWTTNAHHKDRVMSIGRKFQARIKLAPESLFYQKHTDTANSASKQGSNKSKYEYII
jgi:translation initiation factor 4E